MWIFEGGQCSFLFLCFEFGVVMMHGALENGGGSTRQGLGSRQGLDGLVGATTVVVVVAVAVAVVCGRRTIGRMC